MTALRVRADSVEKVRSQSLEEFRLNDDAVFDLFCLLSQIDCGRLRLIRPRVMRSPTSLHENRASMYPASDWSVLCSEPSWISARLPDLYSRAWALALPSIGEAFGLVQVEALACGTPVVGTSSEVIDTEEVGRVFSGDDPAELARALYESLELATDPATRENCRKRANDFSTKKATEEHLKLYEELTADSRQPTAD